MESCQPPPVPKPQDECIDSETLADLPAPMARVVPASLASPTYWKALLSEAENNYREINSRQARALLPHVWKDIPVRVVTSGIASLNDAEFAKAYGISPADHAAMSAARANRKTWEDRQARLCESSADCRVDRLPTTEHYLQNALPERVATTITELASSVRRNGKKQDPRSPE